MQISISNTIGSVTPLQQEVSYIINAYTSRVIADGGVIESINCVKNAFVGYDFKSQYQTRVALDGGVTESVNCFYRIMQDLYLMN